MVCASLVVIFILLVKANYFTSLTTNNFLTYVSVDKAKKTNKNRELS